jgi:hypothetical protein
MRVRIELEGDLVEKKMQRVLGVLGGDGIVLSGGEEVTGYGESTLAAQVSEWLSVKARPAYRSYLEDYLQQITGWGDADLRVGRNANGEPADRVRVHAREVPGGALVHVGLRANLLFRLPRDTNVEQYANARKRDVTPPYDNFGIALEMRSDEAVAEAVKLTRSVLDGAQ